MIDTDIQTELAAAWCGIVVDHQPVSDVEDGQPVTACRGCGKILTPAGAR
jgi:hypothetical protein